MYVSFFLKDGIMFFFMKKSNSDVWDSYIQQKTSSVEARGLLFVKKMEYV